MLTCELIFGKFIDEPEYEYDDCWRTKRVFVTEQDIIKQVGRDLADISENAKLLVLLCYGLIQCPEDYHFCSFGVFRKEN